MVQIYKKYNFVIYSCYGKKSADIIHNKHKKFEEGHTHINNYKTAKYIIDMAYNRSIPKKPISDYLMESIIRVSEHKSYIQAMEELRKKYKNR